MSAVPIGSKPVGSIIKFTVGRTLREFIVVHHGKPSAIYDDSFNDGVIVLQKDCYEERAWSPYGGELVHEYLNGEFLTLIDAKILPHIKNVKVPYVSGGEVKSGADGLESRFFLLSGHEVGCGSDTRLMHDGAELYYFSGINSLSKHYKRVARNTIGSEVGWWLRSIVRSSSNAAWVILGGGMASWNEVHYSYYLRPALVLPSSLLIADDGTVTTNTPPTVPASISIPDNINGGTTVNISWETSSDDQNNMAGYKVEKSADGGSTWKQIYQGGLTDTTDAVVFGTVSVIYRVKAYDTEGMESGWRTSRQAAVLNNSAPTAPININVPVTIIGGMSLVISWGASSDPEGNLRDYVLERKDGDGDFTKVYVGPNLFYSDTVKKGTIKVQYRVKAQDDKNAASTYTTSPVRTVDNASPPVIKASVSNDLGTKDDAFSWQYTVTHEDGEAVTVTEAVDGVKVRSYGVTLGQVNTFNVALPYFITLLNGPHTMTVMAVSSGGKSAVHTVTFTKAVYTLRITLDDPLPADTLITKMVMTVTRSIPPDANFEVLVTNNGLDDSPLWEDATESVVKGMNYVFANKTAVKGNAFNFIVSASRGPGNTGGFISTIGGAFE